MIKLVILWTCLFGNNMFTAYDSVFGISSPNKGTFYSLEKSKTISISFDGRSFAQITIGMDNQVDEYESSVQTLFEAIGTIGGIYEIFKISFGLLVGIYTKKVYEQTIINSLKPDNDSPQPEMDNRSTRNASSNAHQNSRYRSNSNTIQNNNGLSAIRSTNQMHIELQNQI